VADRHQGPAPAGPGVTGIRRRAKAAIRAAVAAGLLGYLFSLIPVSRVLEALTTIHPVYIAIVFCIALCMQCLISMRLKLIAGAQDVRVSVARALGINLAAMFYGLFVPGGNVSRGAIRAYKLSRPSGKLLAAAASIVFDRLIATVALGVIGQIFWLLDRPGDMIPIGLAFFLMWAAPVGIYSVLRFEATVAFVRRWFERHGTLRSHLPGLSRIRDAVYRFRRLSFSRLSIFFATSIAAQLMTCASFYVLALGLGIEVSFVQMAWVSTATTLLAMVPITPSGIGVREGALVFFLGQYHVPGAAALALSFLVFICTVLLVGFLGGLLELKGWLGAGATEKGPA
jgi:hypothetical protein